MLKTFKTYLQLGLCFFFAFLCLNGNGYAQNTPQKNKSKSTQTKKITQKETGLLVSAIDLQGLKKIEKDAVLAKLVSKVGDPYLEENIEKDIQALFKMNYFVQIEVSKDRVANGMNLSYKIIEKPTIAEITFEGNGEIKAEELQTQSGLKQYEVINYT